MPTRRDERRARWARAGWEGLFLLAGLPLWPASIVVLTAPWSRPVREIYLVDNAVRVFFALLVVLAVMLRIAPWLTMWQRRRFRALHGLEIRAVEVPRLNFRQFRQAVRSEALWRQILYHLVVGPVIGAGLLLLALMFYLTGFAVFQVIWHLFGVSNKPGQSAVHHSKFWAQIVFLGLSVVATVFFPQLIGALARADVGAARRLLGPNETTVLARRVKTLAESRAAAVDAADSERRRIERDLHDGAQQRLMSLAVHLGIARKTLKDVPDDAMHVIVDAHEQVKEAMAEIRYLVRGLHPAVLDDRGLDAALSGVAARSAVPVRLTVDAKGPLSASVETAAYFVVSEALANVVKHSQASHASVQVLRVGDRLLVKVTDDGVGGADAERGTGLTGLAQRVASVDGVLRIASPVGGPTVLTAELPCGV